MFRVYTENHESFVDYELLHVDLAVTIDDEDAYFYQTEARNMLDHSPATLGRKE